MGVSAIRKYLQGSEKKKEREKPDGEAEIELHFTLIDISLLQRKDQLRFILM